MPEGNNMLLALQYMHTSSPFLQETKERQHKMFEYNRNYAKVDIAVIWYQASTWVLATQKNQEQFFGSLKKDL